MIIGRLSPQLLLSTQCTIKQVLELPYPLSNSCREKLEDIGSLISETLNSRNNQTGISLRVNNK